MSLPQDFEPATGPMDQVSPDSLVFAFRARELLVYREDQAARVP